MSERLSSQVSELSQTAGVSQPTGATLDSRLPGVGVTVFTRMSQLAAECGALNLSQGFPDFDGPAELLDRVRFHFGNRENQYAPMMGVAALRQAVSRKVLDLYGLPADPETEITITSGATEALYCAIAAVVRPGDEVIIFEPAYDSYEPVVALHGGRVRRVALEAPDYRVPWDRVAALLTPRTRLIITNTPHNPTGTIWRADDMAQLSALQRRSGCFVVADEVYEHILFDGERHESVCRYPELYRSSFVVSSFGKTYHVTGWKIGYCVAPPLLTTEFRKLHQYVTFTSNTPVQLGLADFLTTHPEHHRELGQFYQRKRDRLLAALAGSRFRFQPAAGTYFQTLDYSAITTEDDTSWTERLTRDDGIALIPLSPFYGEPIQPQADAAQPGAARPGEAQPDTTHMVRICFAKDDATLDQAAELLCRL